MAAGNEAGSEVDLLKHLEQKRKEVAAIAAAAEMARAQALSVLELQKRAAELDAFAYGTGSSPSGGAYADAGAGGDFRPRGLPDEQSCLKACGASIAGDRRGQPATETSLTAEDRRRFGLPCLEEPEGLAQVPAPELLPASPSLETGRSPQSPSGSMTPSWSSLSADDRRRFGLDSTDAAAPALPSSSRGAAARPAAGAALGGAPVSSAREAYARRRFDHFDSEARRPDLYEVEGKEQLLKAFRHHPDVLWADKTDDGKLSMSRTLAQLQAVGVTLHMDKLQESERALQRLKLRG